MTFQSNGVTGHTRWLSPVSGNWCEYWGEMTQTDETWQVGGQSRHHALSHLSHSVWACVCGGTYMVHMWLFIWSVKCREMAKLVYKAFGISSDINPPCLYPVTATNRKALADNWQIYFFLRGKSLAFLRRTRIKNLILHIVYTLLLSYKDIYISRFLPFHHKQSCMDFSTHIPETLYRSFTDRGPVPRSARVLASFFP